MEEQIVKTTDEQGNEVNFKLVDIVNYDEQDYALLLPEDENEDDENAEILLMRLIKEGDEYTFETIDDQDEFDLVSQAIIDFEEDNK